MKNEEDKIKMRIEFIYCLITLFCV